MRPVRLAVAAVVATPRDRSLMLASIMLEVLLLIIIRRSSSSMLSAVLALLPMLLHLPLTGHLRAAAVLPIVVLP